MISSIFHSFLRFFLRSLINYFPNLPELRMFPQSIKSNSIMALVNALSRTTIFLPMFLLTCDLGEMVTTAFDEVNEPVYAQAWHLWPLELQKHLIPMLMSIQQPVVFRGLFALDCSRDTFKRVRIRYFTQVD